MPPQQLGRMPIFPIHPAPRCKKCGSECDLEAPNGGRPRYVCHCSGANGVWCTWNDAKDVVPGNPPCSCGYFSRKGVQRSTGETFFSCPVGRVGCRVRTATNQATPPAGGSSSYRPVGPSSSPDTPSRRQNRNDPRQIDPEFERLLNHVLAAAKRAKFPSQNNQQTTRPSGSFDLSDLDQALPDPETFRLQYTTAFDRHSKIGAAGKLFVFKLLHVLLPNEVYKEDWRSTLRNLAWQHRKDLQHLEEREETEESRIFFPDNKGSLTKLLIANGYLDRKEWNGATPEYIIQVKSSMSHTNPEFYLSTRQYELMKKHENPSPSGPGRPKIYVIARVSNLQKNDIDLKLYVDPGSWRGPGNRSLRFTQVWTVQERLEGGGLY